MARSWAARTPRVARSRMDGVTPSDLGATVYHHLGIDLDSQWTDLKGRPQSIITERGRPIPELSK
jgi:hypothetical protein